MAKPRTRRKPPKTQTRKSAKKRATLSNHYWDITHRPLQCLVFLLPMVLAYEIGMALLHGSAPEGERPALAAQQLLKWFFSLFGATGFYLPGAALVAVLIVWHLASRHPWRIAGQPLAGMAGESILLSIPLLMLNRWLPVLEAASQSGPHGSGPTGRLDELLLSVGAGLYEELLFRLIIITLLTMLFVDVLRLRQVTGVALAVILSSLAFAAHHYHPIGADPWSSKEFAFRAAAGAYLAAVFVVRGFGLAVGCHVTYDVMAYLV
jgi:hypothetical protein